MKSFFNYLAKTVFSCNICCFLNIPWPIYKVGVAYLTQKTIKNSISFKGIGLHTGLSVSVCIKPSGPDTGIVFKRIDLKTNN